MMNRTGNVSLVLHYILFTITGLLNFWIILFNLGLSTGVISYFPVAALAGSIIIFILACPVLPYKPYWGWIIVLLGCALIMPFSIVYLKSLFIDWSIGVGTFLASLPVGLTWLSAFLAARCLIRNRESIYINEISGTAKFFMAAIPLALLILYIITYGSDWQWQNLMPHK